MGRTANFPATRGIFTGVTGYLASPVSGGPSDAGLVHSPLGGDAASLSALLDRYRSPPDDPQHCPPAVTQVLFHDGTDQVRRALGYFQPHRTPKPE